MGGHRNDGGLSQWTILELLADFLFARAGVIHEIGFGEGHHAARCAEVAEDLQMLFGLRHPAIVRRHHE